jgi:hypothetical protein
MAGAGHTTERRNAMTRQEYENVCHAAFWGEERKIENRALNETGRVFNCKADTFNVKVGDEWRQWGRQVCDESGPERQQG